MPPPTPKSPENRPASVPMTPSVRVRPRRMAGILGRVPPALALAEALHDVRADPSRSAILLDVDGTLAPIVRHADDAHVPEVTRTQLIAVSRRYALVACVSGRRAATARRMVSIGSIAYVGNPGAEILPPRGAVPGGVSPPPRRRVPAPRGDGAGGGARLRRAGGRVHAFRDEVLDGELHRLRVRAEDKDQIAAFHWRGAPDEEAAEAAVRDIASRAEAAGLVVHWGRKVLEVRPSVHVDKGRGIRRLLHDADLDTAVYAGDDTTDLDAFRGLRSLVEEGRLSTALCVGVRSDETPPALEQE